jgi:hypothetical protein
MITRHVNRCLRAALLTAAAIGSSSPCLARTFTLESDRSQTALPSPEVLRSAFYLRASGRDHELPPASAADRQRALRRHFDLVIAALIARSDQSLERALDRLETHRREAWSAADRAAWRQTLAARRASQIRRLRRYQIRSQFPLNEGQADHAVPIFVDAHDTACAVGHLMRQSGWGDAVASIQKANNFVYVTDVRDGPLVDWVLVSGLTQEEAALIQPSYSPPLFDEGLDVLTQGGSITKNGLRFDNFHFIAGELTDPGSFPEVPPQVNQVDLSGHGAAVRQGAFLSLGGIIDPAFDDWLFVGARSEFYSIYPADDPWGVLYSFDVMPVDDQHRLGAASLESFYANYNFSNLGQGVLAIDASIYASGSTETPLAELSLSDDGLPGHFVGADSSAFEPQQKLTVVTAVTIEGNAALTSLVHSFEMPEAPELESDFDSDGDVDGNDFLAWQRGIGTVNATRAQGDANGDGLADAADLAMWKQRAFGAAGAASDLVPEPAAAILAVCALLGIKPRNRRC